MLFYLDYLLIYYAINKEFGVTKTTYRKASSANNV